MGEGISLGHCMSETQSCNIFVSNGDSSKIFFNLKENLKQNFKGKKTIKS